MRRLFLEQFFQNRSRFEPPGVRLVLRIFRSRDRQRVKNLRFMVLGIFRRDLLHGVAIGDQARSLRRVFEVAIQLADGREIRPFALRFAPTVLPRSAFSRPACNWLLSFTPGAKGLLQSLSAIPQYAIPHVASFPSTALNPSMARLNWKECSRATARLNSFCASCVARCRKVHRPQFLSVWSVLLLLC